MHSLFHNVREYLNPILKESRFKESGVLTPDEFVLAGDFLVFKCPTWSWESGIDSKQRKYLPPKKQFLITKKVPCFKRVDEFVSEANYNEYETEDGWVSSESKKKTIEDVEELDLNKSNESNPEKTNETNTLSEKESSDLCDIDYLDLQDEDLGVLANNINNSVLKTRTYDISITYDKYYQTPRIWLQGYDEENRPLKALEMFKDISVEHARKTVTIEQHPHLSPNMASIHPCQHSNVMKKFIEKSSNEETIRVDQYMILFLKFVATIIPTIEYDYTM